MSQCGAIYSGSQQFLSSGGTASYAWFTGWMPVAAIDSVRAVMRGLNTSGANFKYQICYQVAAVRTDSPSAVTVLGTEQGGDGTYTPGDLTITADSAAWIRFGVAYRSSTGTQQGEVALDLTWNECGRLVATQTFQYTVSSTTKTVVPIGDIIAAIAAQKYKAAILLTSVSGTFKTELCYRAGTIKATMGSWVSLETASSTAERNTGAITASTTNEAFSQGGLGLSSDGSIASATITVLLFARKT